MRGTEDCHYTPQVGRCVVCISLHLLPLTHVAVFLFDSQDLTLEAPKGVSEEVFLDKLYEETGGVARMVNDMIARISKGEDVESALSSVVHLCANEFAHALKVVHKELNNEDKASMVSLALDLMSDYHAKIETPGVFYDGGMTVYDPPRSMCRVINKPAINELEKFLISSDVKWKPIVLSVRSMCV